MIGIAGCGSTRRVHCGGVSPPFFFGREGIERAAGLTPQLWLCICWSILRYWRRAEAWLQRADAGDGPENLLEMPATLLGVRLVSPWPRRTRFGTSALGEYVKAVRAGSFDVFDAVWRKFSYRYLDDHWDDRRGAKYSSSVL